MFAAAGAHARQGFGKRPALLVIDVNYAFASERPAPILDAIKTWHTSCGEEGWTAIAVIKPLIAAARAKGVPVVYTTNAWRDDKWDRGSWMWKNSRGGEKPARTTNIDGNAIVAEIAPGPRDLVVHKQKPSGFFGTPLLSHLLLLGCDSVIVTGATTSGCVRATVLDAFSNNFRVTVVEDGCFDRAQASHAISLCDMDAKYADVLGSDEVRSFLDTYPPGQFDLPAGRQT